MKELRNNFDKETTFTDVQDAKSYYLKSVGVLCSEDEYIGDDYGDYCVQFCEYCTDINNSETLEELADVLNNYTDIFGNGSEYSVVEF